MWKGFPCFCSVQFSVRSYVKDFNRGALPWEEFEEKGGDLAEGIAAAKLLEKYGYDMLNCDNGSYDSWFWPHPPMYMPKACNLADVAAVKKEVSIPVVCAGRFDDPDLAEKSIEEGKIDILGMGRPLLADPEIANKFYEERLADIRPCISCHQGCLGRIFQGKDISCAVNPACGREKSYALTHAETKKKVLVLGGVFVAAATPDFKEDDRHLLAWYKKQMADLPIRIHMNTEVTKEMTAGYDEIFVATGAEERKLSTPGLDGCNVTYAFETLRDPDNQLYEQIKGEHVYLIGDAKRPTNVMDAIWAAYEIAIF